METLGSYIRDRREIAGLSQGELADRLDIARAYLSQIESGKIAFPNADLRRRIATALGVRHIDLIVAAGELTPDEVPGPSLPVRNYADPHVLLCQKLEQVDMSVDRREATLTALLDMFLAQDRSRQDSQPTHRALHG